MSELVLVEKSNAIATVTLNRPEAMNALSTRLRNGITAAFTELSKDEETRVIILTGAGRAFCAGLDLKELGGETEGSAEGPVSLEGDPVESMNLCTQPIIGAINGVAITGGFELALGCDILIGSTNARFSDTHSRVGVIPGWGLSQKLSRMIGIGRAKELSLTGNYLSADQAERWGLLNHVVEPEELLPFCRKLAEDMLSCVPEMVWKYKALIDDGYAINFGDAMKLEKERSRAHVVSKEGVRERRAAIQGRGRTQVSS
ncbi:MAG: enoyl-CoA hydratase [Dehalococcoidia bacterium]|nr:enoyl-CoA hydratase [Dehalococcoidia bacterium]